MTATNGGISPGDQRKGAVMDAVDIERRIPAPHRDRYYEPESQRWR
jgi:hypothetical protein